MLYDKILLGLHLMQNPFHYFITCGIAVDVRVTLESMVLILYVTEIIAWYSYSGLLWY